MGMQSVVITLKALAISSSTRSERGVVCIILNDTTVTGVHTYTRLKNVVESYSAANLAIIKRCFNKYGVKTLKVACYNSAATEPETIADALTILDGVKFNYLAAPTAETADNALIKTFISTQREGNNILAKAVLSNHVGDYEGIINFINNSITMEGTTYTGKEFCVDVACLIATCGITSSITNMAIDGVTAVDSVGTDLDALVDAGKLFLFYDNDLDAIIFSRGVNSKTTIGATEKESLKKIRIVEILDMIRDDFKVTFKADYQGRVENSLDNKNLLISALNTYLRTLSKQGLLSKTEESLMKLDVDAIASYIETNKGIDCTEMTDEEILAIGTDDKVFVTGIVYPEDAMEDLTLVLNY
ncbi:MAG: phage tail sheath subtilisin-like domain-containing protein [Solirubrobacterales bacterium]